MRFKAMGIAVSLIAIIVATFAVGSLSNPPDCADLTSINTTNTTETTQPAPAKNSDDSDSNMSYGYIPPYTGTKAIENINTQPDPATDSTLTYTTYDDMATVADFYRSKLILHNWIALLQPIANEYGVPDIAFYEWTDPAGIAAWHARLQLIIGRSNSGATSVTFAYERFPDIQAHSLLYPGGKMSQSTCKEEISVGTGQNRKVRTRTIIFQTQDNLDQIADYYNTNLPKYGWRFFSYGNNTSFERPGQLGDIRSIEGIHFISGDISTSQGAIRYELWIGGVSTKDGQSEIRIQIIERPLHSEGM
jgi:hypothetical protein